MGLVLRESNVNVAQVFLRSIELFLETRASDIGAAVFDKDDALAVEFVTAAANLRSHVFHIPRQSMFDLKVRLANWVTCCGQSLLHLLQLKFSVSVLPVHSLLLHAPKHHDHRSS